VRFESANATLTITRIRRGLVLMKIVGRDVGEFGTRPFDAMKPYLVDGSLDFFVDLRDAVGATLNVSGEWAAWFQAHRSELGSVSILARTKYVQLTVDFVRRYAGVVELMRMYTSDEAFDEALATATAAG
jgi:hypothetical protein